MDEKNPVNLRVHDETVLPRLVVRKTPTRGKGVFTLDAITAGQVVDVAHIIALTEEEYKAIERTNLYNYVYAWPDHGRGAAVATGFGSHFNHSKNPSLLHMYDYEKETITYIAKRDIESGEELKISYGDELWFEDTEP
eukprot:TRINITY_DN7520_c0_g1_i2.p1 TRINITY_DN7520_c0_g1~~TRINITY_DN7520_c0_g1_i2.p1  ORF type:complete len:156 (+),score=37.33 TRINITY_DN7520_c0_g1_i2:56-469(+)